MTIKTKETRNNFKKLLWENGFTILNKEVLEELAEYFDVTTRTIRRWIKDDRAPKQAIKKLNDKSKQLNQHWDGFRIMKDKILTPNGYEFSANEIKALSIKIALLKNKY